MTNAAVHVGKPCVIALDIRRYFPSIRYPRVYGLFRDLGAPPDVAHILTRLTTYEGRVPEGAPTSSAVANLISARYIEPRLSKIAAENEFTLTFYVDDITISGPISLKRFVPLFCQIIIESGFRHHTREKLKIMLRSSRQEVTGVVVNSRLGAPRSYRDKVRAQIHRFKINAPRFSESERAKEIQRIRGKISYIAALNATQAEKLARYLASVEAD